MVATQRGAKKPGAAFLGQNPSLGPFLGLTLSQGPAKEAKRGPRRPRRAKEVAKIGTGCLRRLTGMACEGSGC